jgi:hypothetical protein
VRLICPFILRNTLCRRLSFCLKYRSGQVLQDGHVEAGQSFAVHTVDLSKDPFLSVTPEQFDTVQWLRVYPKPSSSSQDCPVDAKVDHIVLSDKVGNSMRVKVERLRGVAALSRYADAPAACVLSLSAQYWFVNRTGLSLDIRWLSPDTADRSFPVPTVISTFREELYENERLLLNSFIAPYLPGDPPSWTEHCGKKSRCANKPCYIPL